MDFGYITPLIRNSRPQFSQGRFGQVFPHSGWLVAEQLKVCDFFFWKMLTRPPQQAVKGKKQKDKFLTFD